MKLSAREAPGYFAKPDPKKTGLLIFGSDAMRVALRRKQVVNGLIGPAGEEEMRLTRISAAELRKDPALLSDGIKAQSFFPGPRVTLVEEATDGLAKVITAALSDWQDGDAQLVVTAGSLNARSSLRKLFEGHPNAFSVGLYDDPPSRAEVEAAMGEVGLGDVDGNAMQDIIGLSQSLGPGDFRQTLEKLALYKMGQGSPVSSDDVIACMPASVEAALDDVLNCVAEARQDQVGPILRKLEAQGVQPVGLCIGTMRHFRALHAAASDPGGAAAGMSRLRPPVFGPRRDRMIRQAQKWGVQRLEQALQVLTETDLQLRSSAKAPQMALAERSLIRLAMLGGR